MPVFALACDAIGHDAAQPPSLREVLHHAAFRPIEKQSRLTTPSLVSGNVQGMSTTMRSRPKHHRCRTTLCCRYQMIVPVVSNAIVSERECPWMAIPSHSSSNGYTNLRRCPARRSAVTPPSSPRHALLCYQMKCTGGRQPLRLRTGMRMDDQRQHQQRKWLLMPATMSGTTLRSRPNRRRRRTMSVVIIISKRTGGK